MPPPNLLSLALAAQEAKNDLDVYMNAIQEEPGAYDEFVWRDMHYHARRTRDRLELAVMLQLQLCRHRHGGGWLAQFAQVMADTIIKTGLVED